MSRFTFGFLLGAGAGWAVGSGKAAEWKRGLDDRRALGGDAAQRAALHNVGQPLNDIAPEYGVPNDVASL